MFLEKILINLNKFYINRDIFSDSKFDQILYIPNMFQSNQKAQSI